MSEDNKEVATLPISDFTMKDLADIEKFKENGLMGLHTLIDSDVERMMGLYIDGKTYRQISNITQKAKNVVLYLAHKFNWYELRTQYLEELKATLPQKVIESKLQSQEFLLHLVLAYQKKIGKNINQYLKTDNEEWSDKVDNKDLGSYMKLLELLHRLSSENIGNPNNDKSLVGLNGLGEGVTITKTGNNSVEITPKSSAYASKLKAMAEFKREQERASQPAAKQNHDIKEDIVVENTITQKEEEPKNENP